MNPNGKIPVLELDMAMLSESKAGALYLANASIPVIAKI